LIAKLLRAVGRRVSILGARRSSYPTCDRDRRGRGVRRRGGGRRRPGVRGRLRGCLRRRFRSPASQEACRRHHHHEPVSHPTRPTRAGRRRIPHRDL
jgi:hypothetical protein